jgi:hypothetical protein
MYDSRGYFKESHSQGSYLSIITYRSVTQRISLSLFSGPKPLDGTGLYTETAVFVPGPSLVPP